MILDSGCMYLAEPSCGSNHQCKTWKAKRCDVGRIGMFVVFLPFGYFSEYVSFVKYLPHGLTIMLCVLCSFK